MTEQHPLVKEFERMLKLPLKELSNELTSIADSAPTIEISENDYFDCKNLTIHPDVDSSISFNFSLDIDPKKLLDDEYIKDTYIVVGNECPSMIMNNDSDYYESAMTCKDFYQKYIVETMSEGRKSWLKEFPENIEIRIGNIEEFVPANYVAGL